MTANVNNAPGLGASLGAGVDAVSAAVLVQACQFEMMNQLQTSVGLRATTLQGLSTQLDLASSLGPRLAALRPQAKGSGNVWLGTDAASSTQMISDLGKLGLEGGIQKLYPTITTIENKAGQSTQYDWFTADTRQATLSQAGATQTSNVELTDDQWADFLAAAPQNSPLNTNGQRPASAGTVITLKQADTTITIYFFDAQATPAISAAALNNAIAALPAITDRLANEVRDAQQAAQTSLDNLGRTVQAIGDSGRAGRRDLVRRTDNWSDEGRRSDDRIALQRDEDLRRENGDGRRPHVPSNPDATPNANPASIPPPAPVNA